MREAKEPERRSALEFLGSELGRARARAGMSQDELARAISYSPSQVAMVETGQRRPSVDFVQRADEALGTDGLLTRLLTHVARGGVQPAWFRPWVQIESTARLLLWYETDIIPGLLQAEDYARAVLSGRGLFSPEEVEEQVAACLARQEILNREDPTQLIAVLDELALRRRTPGKPTMRLQLEHLAEQAERPHISIHIVPLSAGLHAGLTGPMILARGEDGAWHGHLPSPLRGQWIDDPEDLGTLHKHWELVRGEALPRGSSLELIRKLATEVE